MWELDHRKCWAWKNWCFWTVVLGKTLEFSLTARRSNQSILKELNSWIFIGRTDEAEASVLWPSDVKSQLIGKDADAGKDWRQEEKGSTEDEVVGWHHWLDRHEFKFRELVMDREAWRATVHQVPKSRTRLRDWTELNWLVFAVKKNLCYLGWNTMFRFYNY